MQPKERIPQDIVAIFHASFHPTKGSVIDWSLKASDDLDLTNVEYNCLPSGLHLVEQDVVYFTKDAHDGVCVFRRRKTTEHGHRGFRLSSLGVLLAKSARPRPWRHVAALKALIHSIYSAVEDRKLLEPTEEDWEPARIFFEERKVRRVDLAGAGDWNGWSQEFEDFNSNPTIHLPHLLRILGPTSLTLYKHILGRRRILIFTLPPVEASCLLCQVAADLCYESQVQNDDPDDIAWDGDRPRRMKGKSKEGLKVLGMVTLNDLDKLHQEGQSGRGWIACTTDAIFLEKPSYYDLIIDLTTSSPSKASRPTFYVSRPSQSASGSRGPSYKLSSIRFTWSDVKLWNEVDRLLELDANDCHDPSHRHACCDPYAQPDGSPKSQAAWTDVWRLYEDVCLICAGLWMGAWRSNSTMSYSTVNRDGSSAMSNWGTVRLEGDDDLSVGSSYVRNVGMGIEGRPSVGSEITLAETKRPRATRGSSGSAKDRRKQQTSSSTSSSAMKTVDGRRDRDILTTMALLQTFHANTCFLLSRLSTYLPRPDADAIASPVLLTPRDLLSFELGPLSSLDARFLEWLTEEYGDGAKVMVKKGWRDLFGLVFGFG